MKRRLSCVLLVILLILALQLPVFANTMNYDSYVPPLGPLNTQDAVVTDANNFIRQFYNLPVEGGDYFTPSAGIPSGSSYTIAPLQVDMTYNISDSSRDLRNV